MKQFFSKRRVSPKNPAQSFITRLDSNLFYKSLESANKRFERDLEGMVSAELLQDA